MSTTLMGVSNNNNIVVAVGNNSTSNEDEIIVSNGDTVVTALTANGGETRSVAYGAGTYVVCGSTGRYWTSPDGLVWTVHNTPGSTSFAVAFGENHFVAVGVKRLLRSSDGLTWEVAHTWEERSFMTEITYNDGCFVAGGTYLFDLIAFASFDDGQTWTQLGTSGITGGIVKMAYGGGKYVAVGGTTITDEQGVILNTTGRLFTSTDGNNWTQKTVTDPTKILYDAAYKDGTWVVVGAAGTLLTSSDGDTWTSRNSGTTKDLRCVKYIRR